MIFSRFFWRVFKKMGYIPSDMGADPFGKVICQGMVKNGGKKMSKSAGNGVAPDEIINTWGSDISRGHIIFAGPIDQDIEWNDKNIIGVSRFVNKFYSSYFKIKDMINIKDEKSESNAINKINIFKNRIEDIYERTYRFNIIISSIMECYNYTSKTTNPEIWKYFYKVSIKAMSPIMPHVCAEMEEYSHF